MLAPNRWCRCSQCRPVIRLFACPCPFALVAEVTKAVHCAEALPAGRVCLLAAGGVHCPRPVSDVSSMAAITKSRPAKHQQTCETTHMRLSSPWLQMKANRRRNAQALVVHDSCQLSNEALTALSVSFGLVVLHQPRQRGEPASPHLWAW